MIMKRNQRDKVDIISVANAAKVSPATVSRAFNHPELVKPTTRRAIERAVEELGYVRNRAAQTIHGKRSGTIGLIVPAVTNAIFSEMIQAFSDVVDEAGFTILIATYGYDLKREVGVLRKLLEHRVDGIAMIGLDHQDAAFTLIKQQKVPAILIWSFAPESRLSCVGCDNFEAGYLAAKHLIDLGHRDIGLAFPPTKDNDRARSRLKGAMQALEDANMKSSEDWTAEAVYNVSLAKQVCLELLSSSRIPSALLCGNDIIAQGAFFAAQRLGLKIPGDLSLVGIGDFPGSGDLEPGLTTVRIPARKIGRQAGHHLTVSIVEDDPTEVLRSKLDVQLIIRGTTKKMG